MLRLSKSIAVLTASFMLAFLCTSADARIYHHHHRRKHHHGLVLPRDYAAWTQVAECETSRSRPWQVLGSSYPDPFGITYNNWVVVMQQAPMAVGPISLAGRPAAIKVADKFLRVVGMSGPPDQGGTVDAPNCQGSW